MNISPKTQRQLTLQNIVFYIFVIIITALLAQVSLKYNINSDWTHNNRHSLSDTTIDFLAQLEQTVSVDVFISPNNPFRPEIESILGRYQRYTYQLDINYINPDFSPEKVRELKIQQQGEMVFSQNEQQQHILDLSEQSITNALITVSRQQEQWLVFIEGHGERTPFNQANFNLGIWGEQLKQKGFKLQALNLIENGQIPTNTAVVVIASPEEAWLEGEVNIIKDYVNNGGNLLWLAEPENNASLLSLSEQLGLEFTPGSVIDPNTEMLGLSDPRFALITNYAAHPIGEATQSVTLYPQATAIEVVSDNNDWHYTPLLTTAVNTWSETEAINLSTALPIFDQSEDTAGPLHLAYLLSKAVDETSNNNKEQRIAVFGDGDFLSNTYVGNASNLELGVALMNWLTQDDRLISIPVKTTIDNTLELTPTQSLVIGLGFLIVLPLVLLSIGLLIWWKRRQR